MKFDDKYFDYLIRAYLNLESVETFQKIQHLLVEYSDFWSKRYYKHDEDLRQDFIIYILSFIQQIINSYPNDLQNVKIIAWINAVLYYKFCDFVKTRNVKQNLVLTDDIDSYHLVEDAILPRCNWYDILDKISIEEKSLWMFYNKPHEMDANLLKSISVYLDKPLVEILSLYQEVLTIYYDTCKIQDLFHQKIKQIDFKIDHLENMINKSTETNTLESKLIRLQARKSKYIRSIKTTNKKLFKVFVKLFKNYDAAYRVTKKIELNIKKILVQGSFQ